MSDLVYLLPILVVAFAWLTRKRGQEIAVSCRVLLAQINLLRETLNTGDETFEYAKDYVEDGRQKVTKHLAELELFRWIVLVTCVIITWILISVLSGENQQGVVFAALGAGIITFSYNLIYEWSNHVGKIIGIITIGISSISETKQVYDKAHEIIGDSNNGKQN